MKGTTSFAYQFQKERHQFHQFPHSNNSSSSSSNNNNRRKIQNYRIKEATSISISNSIGIFRNIFIFPSVWFDVFFFSLFLSIFSAFAPIWINHANEHANELAVLSNPAPLAAKARNSIASKLKFCSQERGNWRAALWLAGGRPPANQRPGRQFRHAPLSISS